MNEIVYSGKYIQIRLVGYSSSGKTKIWDVENKQGELLGKIKWYAPWRQYCYFLDYNMITDERRSSSEITMAASCLEDVLFFLKNIAVKNSGVKK